MGQGPENELHPHYGKESAEIFRHLERILLDPESLAKQGYKTRPLTVTELMGCVRCKNCKYKPPKLARQKDSENQQGTKQLQSHTKTTTNKALIRENGAENQTIDRKVQVQKSKPFDPTAPDFSGQDSHTSINKHIPIIQPPSLETRWFLSTESHAQAEIESDPRSTKGRTVPIPMSIPGVCHYHPGTLVWPPNGKQVKRWSCCGAENGVGPCVHDNEHSFPQVDLATLETNFQFHETPSYGNPSMKRIAVAIDCEMGQSLAGDSELIRLTVIEIPSGIVLIDSLVYPDVPMAHWRTKYSGVSGKMMEEARRKGKCIYGRDNARRLIWEIVGPSTIVVVHAGFNDLSVLRWIHPRIVDTMSLAIKWNKIHYEQLESQGLIAPKPEKTEKDPDSAPLTPKERAAKKEEEDRLKVFPSCSLKDLSWQFLSRQIQKGAHDSVEDAQATMDLAIKFAASAAAPWYQVPTSSPINNVPTQLIAPTHDSYPASYQSLEAAIDPYQQANHPSYQSGNYNPYAQATYSPYAQTEYPAYTQGDNIVYYQGGNPAYQRGGNAIYQQPDHGAFQQQQGDNAFYHQITDASFQQAAQYPYYHENSPACHQSYYRAYQQ